MKKRFLINVIIIIILVLIDQLTKQMLINKNICIIPNVLDLTYIQNSGAAFGIGSNFFVMCSSIIIILLFMAYLYVDREKINNFFPYTLVISGAVGNLIDRIIRGYVIDFIDISFLNFPCFNIADICVVVGIVVLIILISIKIIKN